MAGENMLYAGFKKNKTENAGNTLKRIDSMNEYRTEFIPLEKIRRNPNNDYPIDPEFIKSLKKSILSPTGMVSNLAVYPIEKDEEGHEYELIAGESRLTAIKELQDEGKNVFKSGIPCKIYPSDIDSTDVQIALIEANELTRNFSSERRRIKLKELEELYKSKGKKDSDITKELSSASGIGIRQIQRYRTVNENLIPELITELDNANISLESAAKIATLGNDMQLLIAEFIKTGQVKGNDAIDALRKNLRDKEIENKELENKIQSLKDGVEQRKKELEIREKNIEEKEDEIQKIQDKLKNTDISDEKRNEYENKLKEAKLENEKIKDDFANEKKAVELENENLKKQLEKLKKEKSKEKDETSVDAKVPQISKEEKQKIKSNYQISLIASDVVKMAKKLKAEIEKYEKNFGEKPDDCESLIENIKNSL